MWYNIDISTMNCKIQKQNGMAQFEYRILMELLANPSNYDKLLFLIIIRQFPYELFTGNLFLKKSKKHYGCRKTEKGTDS